jgi:hypothetical protein
VDRIAELDVELGGSGSAVPTLRATPMTTCTGRVLIAGASDRLFSKLRELRSLPFGLVRTTVPGATRMMANGRCRPAALVIDLEGAAGQFGGLVELALERVPRLPIVLIDGGATGPELRDAILDLGVPLASIWRGHASPLMRILRGRSADSDPPHATASRRRDTAGARSSKLDG